MRLYCLPHGVGQVLPLVSRSKATGEVGDRHAVGMLDVANVDIYGIEHSRLLTSSHCGAAARLSGISKKV